MSLFSNYATGGQFSQPIVRYRRGIMQSRNKFLPSAFNDRKRPSTTVTASSTPDSAASSTTSNRSRDAFTAMSMKLPPSTAPPPAVDKYLGYADLPNQVYRRAVKKGFDFNLMLLGESGTGKSTFINSFFTTAIYDEENYPGPSHRFDSKTVEVNTNRLVMKEGNVIVRLSVVDVPGFGDLVDNSDW